VVRPQTILEVALLDYLSWFLGDFSKQGAAESIQ